MFVRRKPWQDVPFPSTISWDPTKPKFFFIMAMSRAFKIDEFGVLPATRGISSMPVRLRSTFGCFCIVPLWLYFSTLMATRSTEN